ncbi:hypothetical protein [Novosphingobium sp. JCM 18896]|uniref:hypothetical protein n=1 Tax=Novosphingobium sp. JCM 18896 TaxID=2989731 RepID=UPI002221442E|nr:hypothetical protein [Novosphingobium sp. JCM 18896]MCW1432169.1 hypothetical protein [Novosphingobium sp. JCM 18896]
MLFALALLQGCSAYPRDIEGTSERIAQSHELHVGYGKLAPPLRARAERFVQAVAATCDARVVAEDGQSNEAMFALLDDNKLDLVMTEVAADSPWLSEVAVIEPLARRQIGNRELGLSAVARNGENRWIVRLESQVRAGGGA